MQSRVSSLLIVLLLFLAGLAQAAPITRVSLPDLEGGASSAIQGLSANGRFVLFMSAAANLVPGDTNGVADLFVHDCLTGDTERVNVASDGTQANGNSGWGPSALSADGRWVAFDSNATNLVPGDTNGQQDSFLHDRQTGATIRVSVADDGTQSDDYSRNVSISADGRYVAFESQSDRLRPGDSNGYSDVFVYDRVADHLEQVSVASDGTPGSDFSGLYVSISADGRYVAFWSGCANLVAGDTNDQPDVFVHDRQTGETTRVSVASDGSQTTSWPHYCTTSADGRYVCFASDGADLAPGDTNGVYDIYLHDRVTGVTERVSLANDGSQGNGSSWSMPWVSADGRYVAFDSSATNLVTGDINAAEDVFLRDRVAGTTERISLGNDGAQGNQESYGAILNAEARYVAFSSSSTNLVPGDENACSDGFVRDRLFGRTERVTVAGAGRQSDGGSSGPALSADGRYVAFHSEAANLVAGDTNDVWDSFLYDQDTGVTQRVSVASDGTEGDWGPFPGGGGSGASGTRLAVSEDGRYVALSSYATNLVPGDTNLSVEMIVIDPFNWYYFWKGLDVFVRDRDSGQTTRVSVASDGTQGNDSSWLAGLSADRRYVAFTSDATNLVPGDTNNSTDIFVHDRTYGETTRVSVASDGTQAAADSRDASLSADGRFMAFVSDASNLVSGDTNGWTDVFVHDRQTGQTTRVSVASDGTQATTGSYCPSLSADGRFVAFHSFDGNLVSGDTNGAMDAFVHDRQTGETWRVSLDVNGGEGDESSWDPALSADGRYVAFMSSATNLVPGDTNGVDDIFVHHLPEQRLVDIPTDSWAYWYIEACVDAGIVGGYGDGTYRPEMVLTRDAMTVFISRAMAGGEAFVPAGPLLPTFTDIPTSHWAYKYIEYAVSCGVTGGYADGTFRPLLIVDRGAMAVFVARAMCGGDAYVPDGPTTASFTDIPTDHWAFRYVEYLRGEGVVGGFGDGTYRPLLAVTRDAMAVYIQRAFDLPM
jgi:Tol biopolymer transport system component